MATFVAFEGTDYDQILSSAISQYIFQKVLAAHNLIVNPAVVRDLLQIFFERHDLWCVDPRDPRPERIGAFYAIKYALEALKLIQIGHDNVLDEEHLINRLKKQGYSPWY